MNESIFTNLNISNQLSQIDTSEKNNNKLKRKSVDHPKEKIWEYYITSNVTSDYSATCHYCSKYWSCGCLSEMEAHLANICHNVPKDIKEYWQKLLLDKIINYKISTTNQHEYLVEDYSKILQTGIYITNEIENIILNIGINKFVGIVTDGGSNVRVAYQIINKKYPHILNI
ncbi:23395_t:CDS:2 [Cetraspora pellucida]|uniref:23395_t:CDS:1 n=1 Tax=Cetraspora pellucida TaxID=1433469 RepID=A0A9N9I9R7_9GLOM|nr:23395_t:CDS:2 [Cetraspora pellucida]